MIAQRVLEHLEEILFRLAQQIIDTNEPFAPTIAPKTGQPLTFGLVGNLTVPPDLKCKFEHILKL